MHPDERLPEWKAWLRQCADQRFASGLQLAHGLRGPDNVARAERLLASAETGGLIQRGDNQDHSHPLWKGFVFFGVGGASAKDNPSPVLFGFSPTNKLLDLARRSI